MTGLIYLTQNESFQKNTHMYYVIEVPIKWPLHYDQTQPLLIP